MLGVETAVENAQRLVEVEMKAHLFPSNGLEPFSCKGAYLDFLRERLIPSFASSFFQEQILFEAQLSGLCLQGKEVEILDKIDGDYGISIPEGRLGIFGDEETANKVELKYFLSCLPLIITRRRLGAPNPVDERAWAEQLKESLPL